MSYDVVPPPNDLSVTVGYEHSRLYLLVAFTCPRCGTHQAHEINASLLSFSGNDIGFNCSSLRCMAVGERPGYSVQLSTQWNAVMLGLNDRPLHEV